jgi:hypothetical protein
MLSAKSVSRLLKPVDDVSEDLIVKLRSVRDNEGHLALAKRLPREIYSWSMEGLWLYYYGRCICGEDILIPSRSYSSPAIIFHVRTLTRLGEQHKVLTILCGISCERSCRSTGVLSVCLN